MTIDSNQLSIKRNPIFEMFMQKAVTPSPILFNEEKTNSVFFKNYDCFKVYTWDEMLRFQDFQN